MVYVISKCADQPALSRRLTIVIVSRCSDYMIQQTFEILNSFYSCGDWFYHGFAQINVNACK